MASHPHTSDSSDDEGPAEESFATGKVEAENVRNTILEKQRKEKEDLKLKRQKRQNLFVTQKQVKVARLDKQQKQLEKLLGQIPAPSSNADDDVTTPLRESEITGILPAQEISTIPLSRNAPKRKFYKDFNIEVKTIKQLKNNRATAAIDFKAKRLSKPHRENILTNKIHAEKLKASGKV